VINLGSAYGEIQIGTGGAEQNIQGLADKLRNIGGAMSLAITTPLAGVAAMALKSAGDFEQSLNVMQQVSGATALQMQALQAQALSLGAETSFSAGEAASAMLELAKAGLSVDEVMAAIGGTMDLAAAGGLDLATAAEITANAVNSFGLEASAASDVANLLAAAANASSVEVTDLAQGMQMASAVFASSGQSIESLNIALALLGNNGMKGSDAGTSLKTMLMRLTAPTDEAAELMASLGISVYDAEGKMRALPDVLADMQQALYGTNAVTMHSSNLTAEQAARMEDLGNRIAKTQSKLADYQSGIAGVAQSEEDKIVSIDRLNRELAALQAEYTGLASVGGSTSTVMRTLTEEQRTQALTAIFGADAIRAVNILLKEGEAGWTDMSAALGNETAAADVAAARMKGFSGAIEYLKGSIDSFLIETALPFLDSLSGFVRYGADLISSFSAIRGPVKNAALAFAAVLAAAGPVMLAIPAIGAALGFLVSPIGLVVAGVAALAAAWTMNLGGIQEATAAAWSAIQPVFATAWAWLQINLPIALTYLGKTWSIVWNAATAALSAAWTTIQWVLGGLPDYINGIVQSIQSGSFDWHTLIPDLDWNVFVTQLADWAMYVAQLAWSSFIGALNWANGLVSSLDWGAFVTQLADWAAYVKQLAWDGLVALLKWDAFIVGLVWGGFVTALDWANGLVSSLDWGAFVTQLADWAAYVKQLAWDGLVALLKWDAFIVGLVWGGFVTALDWANGLVSSLDWGAFVGQLGAWSQYVTQLAWDGFVTVLDWAAYAGGFAWNQVLTALPWAEYVPSLDLAAVTTAFAGVSTAMGTVATAWESVQGVVGKIGEVMAPAFERLQAAVGALPSKVGELTPQFAGLGEAFGGLATALQPVLQALGMLAAALGAGLVVAANLGVNLLAAAFERLPQLLAPIIDQATATINLISSTLTGVTAAVTAIAAGDWSAAWEALKGIVDGVIAYVTDSWTNFTTMFGELGDLFAGIVPPGWFEALTGWEWPEFKPPPLLASLLAWKWPGFPALPSILDTLVNWKWPSLEMPGWLDDLLNWKWPSFPALPSWLGGSSEPETPPGKNARGTNYWRGGLTWVGERGPELVDLPRGARVYDAGESRRMAGAPITINVPVQTANGGLDLVELAHRVAGVIMQIEGA
jgi:TP901 family phage tail tape measure protein